MKTMTVCNTNHPQVFYVCEVLLYDVRILICFLLTRNESLLGSYCVSCNEWRRINNILVLTFWSFYLLLLCRDLMTLSEIMSSWLSSQLIKETLLITFLCSSSSICLIKFILVLRLRLDHDWSFIVVIA